MNALVHKGPSTDNFLKVALGLLMAVYLCNFFTPLRLTNDTVRYLRLVEIKLGSWDLNDLDPDFLPHGYVWFLYGLSKIGLLNPFAIALLQWFFLLGSIVFFRKIFCSQLHFSWMLVLLMLNWNTIKFTLTPLSEMLYLFLSTGALYYFHLAMQRRKASLFIPAIIFAGLGIYTRTAGMSLGLALILTPLINQGKSIREWIGRNKLLTGCIAAMGLGLMSFQLMQHGVQKYIDDYSSPFVHHPLLMVGINIWTHTQEIGELFINIPFGKAKTLLPASLLIAIYTATGLAFVVLFIKALFSKMLEIPPVVRVYSVIYFVMLYCWPMFEVRLWYPLFPFMLLVILLWAGQMTQNKAFRLVWNAWLVSYVIAGIFSLGYYSWLSFDRKAMAERHDAGIWKKEYRSHFFKTGNAAAPDQHAIYILDKYDPMHKAAPGR
ncbi:MAG TPA: hypothetical protein VM488_10895 [Pseudobacter sp.]|nr:hypothetical protein [Pseudobacter sp.]